VSSGIPDRDLVALLRRRHPGAFDELYRRYKDRIWRFLTRLAGRRDLAEDLFQDTWVAAARHAHRLSEETELGAWLFTIARNKHRNGLRFAVFDERRRAALGAAVPPPGPALPEENAAARERVARVTGAWEALAVAHREVLLLAVVEGLETCQIAAVLGLREDAVRKRLSRARAEMARATGLDPKSAEEKTG
jgi:RNA polymerase sigma-70 factor (ECF subfamily)